MKLTVNPYPDIVDQCFKYFKPENRLVRLDIPSLYDFDKLPQDQPFFYIHYDKAYLHYVDQLNRYEHEKKSWISVKSPKAGTIKRFHLLCHDNQYKTNVLGIWQIECYALCTTDVLTPMGYVTLKKLTIFSDTSRMVQCYSSHPLLVSFVEPHNNP